MGKRIYVEATQEGYYGGALRAIGSRFWIADEADFSDSEKMSDNKAGRKGRRGWMKKVDPNEAPAETKTEDANTNKNSEKVTELEESVIKLTKLAEDADARATAAEAKLSDAETIVTQADAKLAEADAEIKRLKAELETAKAGAQKPQEADKGQKTS